MATCPKGHASTDDDYCSECGALIDKAMSVLAAGVPADPPVAAAGATHCPSCGEAREGLARFCEVCRYDYDSTGPAATAPPAGVPPAVSQPVGAGPPPAPAFLRWRVTLAVDPALCPDAQTAAEAPTGTPARSFPLDLPELLVGRTDEKRGIHPEILPSDSGISRRHAQFVRQADGSFMLIDLNSTNGTSLNGKPLVPGVPAPVTDGDQVTLGKWTRMTIQGITT